MRYETLAQTLNTSEEIIQAIAEVVGDDEEAIHAEWFQPARQDAIDYVLRATAISPGRSLFWGAEGCVHNADEE